MDNYERLLKEALAKKSEMLQGVAEMSMNFIADFREDIEEIEPLQDTQRKVRVGEFKQDLVEGLVQQSTYYINMADEYKPVYMNEIMQLFDFE